MNTELGVNHSKGKLCFKIAHVSAGQMAVQGNVGGGSFVCGLKRILTPRNSIELQAALGE